MKSYPTQPHPELFCIWYQQQNGNFPRFYSAACKLCRNLGPVHTGTLHHAHANYGTHCGQWECSHSLQATSKQHQTGVQMCFRVLCERALRPIPAEVKKAKALALPKYKDCSFWLLFPFVQGMSAKVRDKCWKERLLRNWTRSLLATRRAPGLHWVLITLLNSISHFNQKFHFELPFATCAHLMGSFHS